MKTGAQTHHVQHFSHQHPLKLSNHPSHVASLCAGCKLICAGSAGSIYTCSAGCNYFLHTSCAQMPQQMTHPFDQNHVLTLLPIPAYPGGEFRCNACWKDGSGFSYHCGPCDIDLHMNCASMPLSLPPHQQFHHPHQLNLTFSMQPGSPNSFMCDICNNAGHKEWFYWCVPCDFTAHLGCARSKPRPSIPVMPNFAPSPTYAGQPPVDASIPVMPNFAPSTTYARQPPVDTSIPVMPNFAPSTTYARQPPVDASIPVMPNFAPSTTYARQPPVHASIPVMPNFAPSTTYARQPPVVASISVMPNFAPSITYAKQPPALGRIINNSFTNLHGQVNGLTKTVIQSLVGRGGGDGSSFSILFDGSGFQQGNGLDQTVTPDIFDSGGSTGSSGFDFGTTDFGSSAIGGLGDLISNSLDLFG
ncbi:uncharacterized protein LOC126802733 [Argentina anserina]|uniref:uncharacterized protein LOC126802733 n=1 Tax=Argentina anserina TaxID=57926 RepID=UPI0021768471|nr:uncharacterized protein LOC126802733 [Potentilla anserina]